MGDEAIRISSLPVVGRYVIAVSGGVDSMVLLDMLAKQARQQAGQYKITIAYFDHGIRDDSATDGTFVAAAAKRYGFGYKSQREELGVGASEELARTRRYAFLRGVAREHDAQLVTAHHADDIIETIAINLIRGTGWRGLAVLDSDVVRPLLDLSKREIIDYAARHQLTWREDSTNASDDYLRNRIRHKIELSDDEKRQLLALRAQQIWLKRLISDEIKGLIGSDQRQSRYFFTHLDNEPAMECLRHVTQALLTRPQLVRALLAIKTARPGAVYQAGSRVSFRFTSRNFEVELIK